MTVSISVSHITQRVNLKIFFFFFPTHQVGKFGIFFKVLVHLVRGFFIVLGIWKRNFWYIYWFNVFSGFECSWRIIFYFFFNKLSSLNNLCWHFFWKCKGIIFSFVDLILEMCNLMSILTFPVSFFAKSQ